MPHQFHLLLTLLKGRLLARDLPLHPLDHLFFLQVECSLHRHSHPDHLPPLNLRTRVSFDWISPDLTTFPNLTHAISRERSRKRGRGVVGGAGIDDRVVGGYLS
ncbi:hypothetical protein J3R30DRAFT_635180 [Lentinula aciculospora]|uniref:Secreted protein n=1 Tax=Lentinula aciculospora TaxID=153920 RepID=A0A9W9DKN7_9AGAR|nr:hypothetical protein J3R30DRAFT_635180 [Lentinula aciculospora]